MLNKKFHILIQGFLFLLTSCSGGADGNLKEALSWVPADSRSVGFDNWKQIKEDFHFTPESLQSGKWRPSIYDDLGNEVPSEKLKDDLALYAQTILTTYPPKSGSKKIGFEYPDIEWEMTTHQLFKIIKFNDSYKRKALDDLLKKLQSKKETYKGYEIFTIKFDYELWSANDVNWINAFQVMCYIEEEKMLLSGPDMKYMKAAIDAHESGNNFLSRPGVSETINQLGNFQNVFLLPGGYQWSPEKMVGRGHSEDIARQIRHDLPEFLGISEEEIQTLCDPVCVAIAEEKNGKAKCVLTYNNASDANIDEPKRLKVFTNGRLFSSKMQLNKIFLVPSSYVSGNSVVLNWQMMPFENEVINCIIYGDMPWCVSVKK